MTRIAFTVVGSKDATHVDLPHSGCRWDVDQFHTLRIWDGKKLIAFYRDVNALQIGPTPR